MRLPLLLLVIALVAAATVAYGTDPRWGEYAHGLALILRVRRFQAPLALLSLVPCLVLIGLVISGKCRAWWLAGLAPVLVLFTHRFATDPAHRYLVSENPPLVSAAAADFLHEDDHVVGLTVAGTDLAFPFSALNISPVVVQSVHNVRCLVIWSPYANRAIAFTIGHDDIKPRELDIVSMPSNALLLYNERIGQFINGVTGRTPDGAKPSGFLEPLETQKTTWSRWRSAHPETQVMSLPGGASGSSAPQSPRYGMLPMANSTTRPTPRHVILVASTQPVAIDADAVSAEVFNISGPTDLLIFREPGTGRVRAFDRRCNGDLSPLFIRKIDPKHVAVAFVDCDSGSEWSGDLHALSGPLEKEHLRPIVVEDDLDWSVIRAWYPGLELAVPLKVSTPPNPPGTHPPEAPHRRSH